MTLEEFISQNKELCDMDKPKAKAMLSLPPDQFWNDAVSRAADGLPARGRRFVECRLMDATQKCPECKSLLETTHEYECGTTVDAEGHIVWQSPQCEFRVTQNLRDEIARLKAERDKAEAEAERFRAENAELHEEIRQARILMNARKYNR